MWPPQRILPTIVATGLIIGATTACTAKPGRGSSAPAMPEPAAAAWFQSNLPLGDIPQLVFDLHRELDQGLARVVAPCMARLGFEYKRAAISQSVVPFRRYGPLPTDPTEPYAKALPSSDSSALQPFAPSGEAYTTALFGSLEADQNAASIVKNTNGKAVGRIFRQGGCMGQAEEQIFRRQDGYTSFAADDIQIQTALAELTDRLWTDRQVRSALIPWVKCVTGQGLVEPTRLDYFVVSFDWASTKIDDQLRIFRIETECKSRNPGVVARVFAVDWQLQTDFIEKNHDLVSRYRSYLSLLKGTP